MCRSRTAARFVFLGCLITYLGNASLLYASEECCPDAVSTTRPTALPFKGGDRIAFVGDSITHGGQYPHHVFAYYVTRFPDTRITWFNNGLNGDTAKGAIRRVHSDVMLASPNRAIIMLGMNDIRRSEYKSANPDEATRNRLQAILDAYQQDMATLVDMLVAHGVEVTVLGPSPYDNTVDSPAANAFGANDALSHCSEFLKAMASGKGLGYVDFNAPMRIANAFLQKGNPQSSIISVHDRVHPGPVGTLMMAYLLLKGQGVPAEVATVEMDVADPSRTRGANCTVSNIEMTVDGVSYLYLPAALPFPVVAGYPATDSIVPFTDELNREMITVHNLKDGIYRLEMDGVEVGRYTAHDLKRGINIAILPGNPGQVQSQRMMKSLMDRMSIDQNLRTIQETLRYLPDGIDATDAQAVKAHLEALVDKRGSDDYAAKRIKSYLEIHKPKEADYIRQIEEWHVRAYSDNKPQARTVNIRYVAGRDNVSETGGAR